MPLDPLAVDAVLVHVGIFKTGTTALQNRLSQARPQLAEHGVCYPGEREAHHHAAQALRGVKIAGTDGRTRAPERWDALVADVAEATGRVVVSSEFFAQSTTEIRQRLVQELGGDRVHIAIGVRNPASHVLSSWQQSLKDGRTTPLDEWLVKSFKREPGSTARPMYWKYWDPVRIVENWVGTVGPDRVTVMLLDESDHDFLGRTFEELLDLPGGTINDVKPTKSNRSMTVAEAECVRRVNLAVKDVVDPTEYSRLVRYGVINQLVEERRPVQGERRSALPRWAFEQARVEARRIGTGLRATGAQLAGSVDSLNPPERTLETGGEKSEGEMFAAGLGAEAALGAVLAGALKLQIPKSDPLSMLTAGELAVELRKRARRKASRAVRRIRAR